MYDYAGEWIYRVGMPAKSGVGGGIVAALPAQLGLGTFSPRLDSHGNSVRGLKVCEALSAHFDLHMLNRSGDVRTCVIADYDIFGISSRRSRQPHEQQILDERHSDIRVIELVGALTFRDHRLRHAQARRRAAERAAPDPRLPPRADITAAGAQLLGENLTMPRQCRRHRDPDRRRSDVAGLDGDSRVRPPIAPKLRRFALLDEAIEWAEDQVIYRYGGFTASKETSASRRAGAARRIWRRRRSPRWPNSSTARRYQAGQRIIGAGEPANFAVLPAKRHGQREAAERRAAGLARARAWNSARWR